MQHGVTNLSDVTVIRQMRPEISPGRPIANRSNEPTDSAYGIIVRSLVARCPNISLALFSALVGKFLGSKGRAA